MADREARDATGARELLDAAAERCDWNGCDGEAVHAYNDVTVRPPPAFDRDVRVGRVALCREHLARFHSDRYVELDWDRVLRAEP